MEKNRIDIKENFIFKLDNELLEILLKDRSSKKNIIWATDNYADKGFGYRRSDYITVESIVGYHGNVIKPRTEKSKKEQTDRIRDKAEVFTPSWICNKQNNLVDNAWFGTDYVFNIESDKSWDATTEPIRFPTITGKTWQDYIDDVRLEITCGEAPYLVSRYDTVTGEEIEISRRIGLLDRKLRVLSENVDSEIEWYSWAKKAFQSIYGFEWQGDNLLLARENLLFAFVDYYENKFGIFPIKEYLKEIATIISWNIWQMDGLKGVIPNSCGERRTVVYDLFEETETISQCEGCKSGNIKKHNGTYALIKDWSAPKAKQKIRFIDLIK